MSKAIATRPPSARTHMLVSPLPPVEIVTFVVTVNIEPLVLTPNTGASGWEETLAYSMPVAGLNACTKVAALGKATRVEVAAQ